MPPDLEIRVGGQGRAQLANTHWIAQQRLYLGIRRDSFQHRAFERAFRPAHSSTRRHGEISPATSSGSGPFNVSPSRF